MTEEEALREWGDQWQAEERWQREAATQLQALAARVKVLEAENERLRDALKEVFEAWAGSEGFIPETAPEGYLLYLTKRMAHIAREGLGETK